MPATRSIGSQDKDNKPGLEWHVGEAIPVPKTRVGVPTPKVIEVQADGDELTFIDESFSFIPFPMEPVRVVRWFGDMAQFIYHNLPRS